MASALLPPRIARLETSREVPTQPYLEAESQTGLLGAICIFSGGYVEEGASALTGGIIGIAAQAFHDLGANQAATGSDPFEVHPVMPGVILEMNMDTSSAGAATGNGTAAQTDIGTSYGLRKDSTTGIWFVDKSNTTGGQIAALVIGIRQDVVLGTTTQPRVFVEIHHSYTVWN